MRTMTNVTIPATAGAQRLDSSAEARLGFAPRLPVPAPDGDDGAKDEDGLQRSQERGGGRTQHLFFLVESSGEHHVLRACGKASEPGFERPQRRQDARKEEEKVRPAARRIPRGSAAHARAAAR